MKNVKADEFIMVYLDDLSAMMKLNEAQLKLTMLLWKKCSYASENEEWNRICIYDTVKQQWMQELGCSKPYIDKLLKALRDKDIITKVCTNVYDLNPRYFFKGPTKIREAVIKTSIKYNIEANEDFE